MPDDPPIMDYATPTQRKKGKPKRAWLLGSIAVAMVAIATLVPRIAGSGRTAPNKGFDLVWLLAFLIVDLYIWARLREEKPGFDVPRLLIGIGATGCLCNLALMLIMWTPPWAILITLCLVSFLLAALGSAGKLMKKSSE